MNKAEGWCAQKLEIMPIKRMNVFFANRNLLVENYKKTIIIDLFLLNYFSYLNLNELERKVSRFVIGVVVVSQ